MFHNKAFHTLLAALMLLSGCKKENLPEGVVLIDADDAIEASITDVAENIKVIQLHSDDPIDGIASLHFSGNLILALDQNNSSVTVFEDYAKTAVLSRQGRGHGEYNFISSCAFSSKDNAILVSNDTSILMYSYPDMKFLGTPWHGMAIESFCEANDNQLFSIAMQEIPDDNFMSYPIYFILIDTEEWTSERIDSANIVRYSVSNIDLSSINPSNRVMASAGWINRIRTFQNAGSQQTVFEFSYGEKGLPRDLYEQDMEAFESDQEAYKYIDELFGYLTENNTQSGIAMPVVSNGTVSFLYQVQDGIRYNTRKIMAVSSGGKTAQYSKLTVPGLKLGLTPMAVHGTSYVCLIEADPEEIIDADAPLSPLAEQILKALKKQNDFNPILVEFSMKAPL